MPAYAQLSSVDASQFEVQFAQSEIEFKGNELVSNPVRIVNKSLQKVSVYLEISAPPGWIKLGSGNRLYEVSPKDTIYIPLRVVPAAKTEGNTMYSINAFVRSDEGLPLGAESFFCFTKKMVSWEMSVLPEDKIYLKNGEEIGQFSLSMLNTGNFQDEFQLTLQGADRQDVVLMDTMGNIIRNPSYTLQLDGGEDTTLNFLAKPSNFRRNFRTISTNNHRPVSQSDEKRFRIYASSQEAQRIENDQPVKGSKVDFIRLANVKKISPYASQSLPLVVETQIQNILSDYSFMAMNLRGMKQFNQDKRLIYFTQLLYSQNYFNPNFFSNTPWFVGYYDKNWDVQLGMINTRTLGLTSGGRAT